MKQPGVHSGCQGLLRGIALLGAGLLAASGLAQTPRDGLTKNNPPATGGEPYKIVNTAQWPGDGAIHDLAADSEGRRLYVPRGSAVLVFDLDTLKPAATLTNIQAHGVAVDAKCHHAFASSQPLAMWDTRTQSLIKTIPAGGDPDGILCDPASDRIVVLSHSAPNVTVLDARDGSLLGTLDLDGEPEQGQCDGQGRLYVELEDQDSVAVVDLPTLKRTATYQLGGQGGGPEGLGLDVKNHRLFVFCRKPATCVVLNTEDGRILDSLPIGEGSDDGGFNPNTMEAFSSQRDGTLTIIKETSPAGFVVEQNVRTKPGAKTCALDTRKNQIVLITVERPAVPAGAPADGRPGGRGYSGPGLLDILVAGPATVP
jgi:DNA-binding beta-propeller fold protein YncE